MQTLPNESIMASAESIQVVGDEWTMVYLNRETGERLEYLNDEDD